MAAVTRLGLSGSTDGRPIKVDDIDFFPGTAIHTAVNNAGDYDEVWLWACNTSTSIEQVHIGWGGTTGSNVLHVQLPPESGLIPIIPGLVISGGAAILARVALVANVVNILGYVNRYDADGDPSTVFTKNKLSASSNGMVIAVAASATPGTTIHTATSSNEADEWDEIWLWAHNDDFSNLDKLTLEFGGTTDPDDLIEITIPTDGAGLTLVVPGLVLHNSQVLSAFSTNTDVNLLGYVNEIRTP